VVSGGVAEEEVGVLQGEAVGVGVEAVELEVVLHEFVGGGEQVVGGHCSDTGEFLEVADGAQAAGGEGVEDGGALELVCFWVGGAVLYFWRRLM
jgi:hypothetical protein